MLIDSARITVRAGRGGNGCVSFRREKHVPRGGPNGGDGGRGGSVILRADNSYNTLLHVHHRRFIDAKKGRNGEGSDRTGASADDVVLPVPPGTMLFDVASGEMVGDLVEAGQEVVAGRGGRGGRGNAHFASSRNQTPRHAEDGGPGEERELRLELKLLADIGLVGLPNAGKSTLLSRVSAARPKVADYPFTTLEPHLGVMQFPSDDLRTLVVADIPGLIEGAHHGAGLGARFLRHVERCQVLAHLVDLAQPGPLTEPIATIRGELKAFSTPLDGRPWLLVGTKLDAAADPQASRAQLADEASKLGVGWVTISAATGAGLHDLAYALFELVERCQAAETNETAGAAGQEADNR